MIHFFCLYAALAALSLAGSSAACDPPAQFRQAAPGYQMMPQQYAPPGYMLVPIPRQQYAPPPMMFAQASYGGQAMIVAAPRAGYGASVSIENRRAILPGNRTPRTRVNGGVGAGVSVRASGGG